MQIKMVNVRTTFETGMLMVIFNVEGREEEKFLLDESFDVGLCRVVFGEKEEERQEHCRLINKRLEGETFEVDQIPIGNASGNLLLRNNLKVKFHYNGTASASKS